MFERRSSSLDRPWNIQSHTQVIGNGPATGSSLTGSTTGSGFNVVQTAQQQQSVQRSTSQSSLYLQPKPATQNRVSFKQVSFDESNGK